MRINNYIERPLVTEKSVGQSGLSNEYSFKVNMKATKHAIAKEVHDTFGVDVLDVRTSILPGKKRRLAGTFRFTKTAKWKKAIVKVKEGQKIDLYPSEK